MSTSVTIEMQFNLHTQFISNQAQNLIVKPECIHTYVFQSLQCQRVSSWLPISVPGLMQMNTNLLVQVVHKWFK